MLGVSDPGNADDAGLRVLDIMLKIDGNDITDLAAMKALYERIVAEKRPKKRVLLEVLRDGLPRYLALDYEKDYDVPGK